MQKNFIFIGLSIFAVLFLFPQAVKADITDDSESDFDAGTHTNTDWDASDSWVEMDSTGLSSGFATFTSRIFDGSSSVAWSSISWVPQRPLYKELPNSEGVETAYTTGNISMANNELLYHLNESSGSILDTSGNGLNGTLTGATYGVTGKFQTALSFDGTNDQVSIPDNAALDMNGGDFTASFWLKTTQGAATVNYLQIGKSTYVTRFLFSSGLTDTSKISFAFQDNAGATLVWYYNAGSGINDGNWHHIVGVRSSGTAIIYVDGISKSYSSGNIAYTNANLIGEGSYTDFTGQMDEVAIWSRALSATDALNMYKRGAQRLKFQVRSCDDASCSGESFQGWGASTSDFLYESRDTTATSLPSVTLSGSAGSVSDNRYFQYRTMFETTSSTLNSELKSVTVGTTATEGGGGASTPEFTDIVYVTTLLGAFYFMFKVLLPKYVSAFVSFIQTRFKLGKKQRYEI